MDVFTLAAAVTAGPAMITALSMTMSSRPYMRGNGLQLLFWLVVTIPLLMLPLPLQFEMAWGGGLVAGLLSQGYIYAMWGISLGHWILGDIQRIYRKVTRR